MPIRIGGQWSRLEYLGIARRCNRNIFRTLELHKKIIIDDGIVVIVLMKGLDGIAGPDPQMIEKDSIGPEALGSGKSRGLELEFCHINLTPVKGRAINVGQVGSNRGSMLLFVPPVFMFNYDLVVAEDS